MATKSQVLGPGSLKIGETATALEFAAQLTKCALEVSTDSEDDIPTLDGGTLAGEDTDKFSVTGTLLQDYELASLELYCFDNKGETLPFVFTPTNESGVQWSGNLKIRPVNVGGDVKKRNTSDFSFPVIGDPTHGEVTAP